MFSGLLQGVGVAQHRLLPVPGNAPKYFVLQRGSYSSSSPESCSSEVDQKKTKTKKISLELKVSENCIASMKELHECDGSNDPRGMSDNSHIKTNAKKKKKMGKFTVSVFATNTGCHRRRYYIWIATHCLPHRRQHQEYVVPLGLKSKTLCSQG